MRPAPGPIASLFRKHIALILAIAAPLTLVVTMLGPALVGSQTFGAIDITERTAPWYNSSVVDSVHNRCVGDTVDAIHPGVGSLHARLASGDAVPLWDPHPSAGTELLATQKEGYFSPVVFPALFASDTAFPAWVKFLEMAAVFGGMWLWLRRVGTGRAAAALGGLFFAGSGFMVMWTGWPQTRTAALIPLVFWAVERVVQDRTVRSAWPLAAAMFSLIAGGFLAVATHATYAALIYALVRILSDWRRGRGGSTIKAVMKPISLGITAAVVGVGAIGFQVISFAERFGAIDTTYRANLWKANLHPAQALTAYYGTGFGGCPSGEGPLGTVNPVEGNLFVGSAALMLIALAVVGLRGLNYVPGVQWYLISGSVVLGLAIFLGGPISWLLHLLPLMDNSPMPRIHGLLGFLLAGLAAMGFDALIRNRDHIRKRGASLVGLGIAIAFQGIATAGVLKASLNYDYLDKSLAGMLLGLGAAGIVAGAWLLLINGKATRLAIILVALIPLGALAETLVFTSTFWTRSEPIEYYRDTDTTTYLQGVVDDDRILPIHSTFLGGRPASPYGIRSLTGHVFVNNDWKDLVTAIDSKAFASPTFQRVRTLEVVDDKLLDRLSVTHVVAGLDIEQAGEVASVTSFVVPSLTANGSAASSWDGSPITFEVEPGRLRGFRMLLEAELPDAAESAYVFVTASDGVSETTSRVRLSALDVITLPLAAETMTTSAITVTVSHDYSETIELTMRGSVPWIDSYWGNDDVVLVRAIDAQIYLRPTAGERVRWATDAIAAEDLESYLRFARTEPTSTVIASRDVIEAGTISGAPASITVIDGHSDELTQRVVAEGDGLLIIADAYHEQWTAYIDGNEVPVHKVEWALTGIYVPEGDHLVVLKFEPAGWGSMLYVSGGCALLIVGFAAWDLLSRRRDVRQRRNPVDAQ